MSKSIKRLSMGLLAGATVFAWWCGSGGVPAEETAAVRHFANQVWLQRMPENERDQVWHFVALDRGDGHGKIGAFGKASRWRQRAELFRWRLRGRRLGLFFPQQRKKAGIKVKTWNCEGEAPAPFELCLRFGSGDRSHTFYSKKGWKLRSLGEDVLESDTYDGASISAVLAALESAERADEDTHGHAELDGYAEMDGSQALEGLPVLTTPWEWGD
ncbi:MAG: hypothetical protein V3V08_11340 [Nannocystaceae bacterium]